jgi:hypothetical protein
LQRISRLIFVFALLFSFLILAPAFLGGQFGPFPLIKAGDVVDLFSALILLPLYWLLFQLKPEQLPKQLEMILFMAFAGAWASGQGMHLSANSIGHLLQDMQGSDVYVLTYFYDEELSHLIWHLGIIGLSALMIYRQWNHPFIEGDMIQALVIIAGLIYGLTYALAIMEGGTGYLGVPFAFLTTMAILIFGRGLLKQEPLNLFFLIAYLLASIIFISWLVYWSASCGQFSFPQTLDAIDGLACL